MIVNIVAVSVSVVALAPPVPLQNLSSTPPGLLQDLHVQSCESYPAMKV